MRTPEAREKSADYSRWIQYEYTGNCARFIQFDPEVVKRFIRFIGTPRRPLIIRDGFERNERLDVYHTWEFGRLSHDIRKERKKGAEIEEKDDAVVLSINSHVIDGRIQERQKKDKFGHTVYIRQFTERLAAIISLGLLYWAGVEARESIKGKSVFGRAKKKLEFSLLASRFSPKLVNIKIP